MTDDAQWYDAMAAAMKKREKCLNAINRWQLALQEAEDEMRALRGEQPRVVETAPGPVAPEGAVPALEWMSPGPELTNE